MPTSPGRRSIGARWGFQRRDVELSANIGAALCTAFVGGFPARLLKLPIIVGYLLAGVTIGPFTPGFVGNIDAIGQLAELSVIFLMFGVGLTRLWSWSLKSGLVLGLAISTASTVVLLRGLMDAGLLDTRYGQAAVGWLVLEDLASVAILVALPTLTAIGERVDWPGIGWTLLKAGLFVGLMLVVGGRLAPWLLLRLARTRSRELFILVILAVALGTGLGSAALFGVSLALGAFPAGMVVSESPLSHQVGADVLPFREAFAVLFFAPVGMLVNPVYLLANAGQALALTAPIVAGKSLIAASIGFLAPHPARTALVVAAGLSQIGEFSFIVGRAGLALGLLTQDQYSLILAGAPLSITINPLMFRLVGPVEGFLKRFPAVWRRLDRHGPAPVGTGLAGHVVVVGWGRVGRHIVDVLEYVNILRLVMETDATRVETLRQKGVPTLFGDAANSGILEHAQLDRARALVVTVPDEASTALIVSAARATTPELPIVARAVTESGVKHLNELGAQDVIHPELEGSLAIVGHTLLRLGLPLREVQKYAAIVRREHDDLAPNPAPAFRPMTGSG